MILPTVHVAGPVQLALGGLRQECARCGAVLREQIPDSASFLEDAAERYALDTWAEGAEIVIQGSAAWTKDRRRDTYDITMECA